MLMSPGLNVPPYLVLSSCSASFSSGLMSGLGGVGCCVTCAAIVGVGGWYCGASVITFFFGRPNMFFPPLRL